MKQYNDRKTIDKRSKNLKEWNTPNIINLELKKTKSGTQSKTIENTKNDHSGRL